MDDPTFNRVVTEISTFYRAITAPFLSRMPDNGKYNKGQVESCSAMAVMVNYVF